MPEKQPTGFQIVRGATVAVLKIKNENKKEVVLWPFLAVQVHDANGKPVKKTTNIGRWGVRFGKSAIESVDFVKLAAGETHEIKVDLKRYMFDPEFITGWRMAEVGDYKLAIRYQFGRKEVKKSWDEDVRCWMMPNNPEIKRFKSTRRLKSSSRSTRLPSARGGQPMCSAGFTRD